MRLKYSEELKLRNTHSSGSLGTLCHSVWVRWPQKVVKKREKFRRGPSKKFKQWGALPAAKATVVVRDHTLFGKK